MKCFLNGIDLPRVARAKDYKFDHINALLCQYTNAAKAAAASNVLMNGAGGTGSFHEYGKFYNDDLYNLYNEDENLDQTSSLELHDIQQHSPFYFFVRAFLVFAAYNLFYALVASFLVYIEPVSAGSGIPEMKCFLNGIDLPRVARAKDYKFDHVNALLCQYTNAAKAAAASNPM